MKLYIRITSIILMISVIISGCLKDKLYDSYQIQSVHAPQSTAKIIEIKTNAVATSNFYTITFNSTNNDTVVNFVPVNLATSDVASQDIHVTLMQNDQLVNNYNSSNQTAYVIPPSNLVTILNQGNVVVIPKGQHTGYLQIKYKPSALVGTLYALAFSIKSIQEPGYIISGNAQNGIGALIGKNQYDGTYITKGTFVHPSYGSTWTFNDNVQEVLYTTGQYSVEGNPLVTQAANIGVPLDITVSNDNTLNITLRGVPSPSDPQNRYDPVTRTFYVKGGYGGGSRRLTDTLTYLHP